MKINLIVHPIATGESIEFRSTNPKQKAWVKLGQNNGHYWLQFHTACGNLSSYIHQVSCGVWVNENGLFMPKYAYELINTANNYLTKMAG